MGVTFGRMAPPVPALAGRLCVVTGAASGIGRAVAQAAVREGARVAMTDVRAEPLAALAASFDGDAVACTRALDIADVEAVRSFADEVHAVAGSADVLFNVAGIATWGRVDRLTHEQWRRTVDVDLMGPIHVIEAFVPAMMRARRGGQIVNVASAAALVALPWHAPYSAAKYGLRGVSEVLRFDLRRHRIGVTLVCPGGVDTGLVDTVDIAGIDMEALRSRGFADRFRRHAQTPEAVAAKILAGVRKNKKLVHTSHDIRFLYGLERWAPAVYDQVMRIGNARFVALLERALLDR
jgi:NAD(P)-dependent dehydrogenase (short-subunit alcohol dehydrogenase family)